MADETPREPARYRMRALLTFDGPDPENGYEAQAQAGAVFYVGSKARGEHLVSVGLAVWAPDEAPKDGRDDATKKPARATKKPARAATEPPVTGNTPGKPRGTQSPPINPTGPEQG